MNTTITKHILPLFSFILILVLSAPCCISEVSVSPSNLSVVMENDVIEGNTTQKITVTNKNSYNISVRAWMIHPDVIEWIRPNRTLIDNLSWITIEPETKIIPAHSTGSFYIYISIPNESKNQIFDSRWEIWAALQIDAVSGEQSSLFGEGYLVRVYVDAPKSPFTPNDSGFVVSPFHLVLLLVVFIFIISLLIFYYHRRKQR